jgi:hypothetical protein
LLAVSPVENSPNCFRFDSGQYIKQQTQTADRWECDLCSKVCAADELASAAVVLT